MEYGPRPQNVCGKWNCSIPFTYWNVYFYRLNFVMSIQKSLDYTYTEMMGTLFTKILILKSEPRPQKVVFLEYKLWVVITQKLLNILWRTFDMLWETCSINNIYSQKVDARGRSKIHFLYLFWATVDVFKMSRRYQVFNEISDI